MPIYIYREFDARDAPPVAIVTPQSRAYELWTGDERDSPLGRWLERVIRDAVQDEQASLLLNCDRLQYDVRTIESFSGADTSLSVDEEGNMTEMGFETGGVSDIVIIRAAYLYPMMTPLIGQFFADYPGNRKLLLSTVVMRTEPYDFEDEGG